MTVVVVLAVVVAGAVVWQKYNDPETAFNAALRRSLSTPGVSCRTSQTSGGTTTQQTVQLDLASKSKAQATATVSKTGASVTTHEISSRAVDYVRYTAIDAGHSSTSAGPADLGQVLNVWSKTASSTSPLFDRTVLGDCIVPLADLPSAQLKPLALTLETGDIFKTDFQTAKRTSLSGRPAFSYSVAIQPIQYVDLMQQLAKIYGFHDLTSITTSSLSQQSPVATTFYVDKRSRQFVRIDLGSAHRITFSDYGIVPKISVPKATISATELTQRLQAAQ